MNTPDEIRDEINTYLDQVRAHLGRLPQEEVRDIVENLENHIHELLRQRAHDQPTLSDLRAVLAEMDPPESYSAQQDAVPVARETARPRVRPEHKPDPGPPKPSFADLKWSMLRLVVFHSLVPIALFIYLVYKVPAYQRMFEEMDVALPSVTLLVLSLSDFVQYYWYLLAFLACPLLVVDCGVYFVFCRYLSNAVARAWAWFVVLSQLAILTFCLLAIWLPLRSLMQATADG